ncbi:hypothetical protein WJX77_004400 [Trebouxia sp. C0004]
MANLLLALPLPGPLLLPEPLPLPVPLALPLPLLAPVLAPFAPPLPLPFPPPLSGLHQLDYATDCIASPPPDTSEGSPIFDLTQDGSWGNSSPPVTSVTSPVIPSNPSNLAAGIVIPEDMVMEVAEQPVLDLYAELKQGTSLMHGLLTAITCRT